MHEKKLRDPQLIYYQLGGDFHVLKDLETLPIQHRHHFDELLQVAELPPAGDIAMPNETLTLEWFYMTFQKSERDQYIASGRRLVDEMIESVTEYFESLFNIKKSNSKLQLLIQQRDSKMSNLQRGATKNNNKPRYSGKEHRTSRNHDYRNNHNYRNNPNRD
jgi:hypothetical protein